MRRKQNPANINAVLKSGATFGQTHSASEISLAIVTNSLKNSSLLLEQNKSGLISTGDHCAHLTP